MKWYLLPILLLISWLPYQQIANQPTSISFVFEEAAVKGTIAGIESSSIIDINQFEKSVIKGSVSVTTLDTGNFLRDGHLMWKKYFNRSEYPRIYLQSTDIVKKDRQSYIITANLTMKGITNPIILNAVQTKGSLKVTSAIFTSDWNIKINEQRADNKLSIVMDFKIEK
jgi:polyisoprenoid-binding protein YceI